MVFNVMLRLIFKDDGSLGLPEFEAEAIGSGESFLMDDDGVILSQDNVAAWIQDVLNRAAKVSIYNPDVTEQEAEECYRE